MTNQLNHDQRLNVLHITPWYPTDENPVNGIFVREYAKAVQLFCNVAVLHFEGYAPHLSSRMAIEKVTSLTLTEGIATYRARYRSAPNRLVNHFERGQGFLRSLWRIQKDGFRPDIIHAHVHTVSLPAVLLGYLWRIPVVITEHHSAFSLKTLGRRQIKEAQVAFKRASRVLPVSMALQKSIESYQIDARFKIVPNVVDIELFQPKVHPATAHEKEVRFLCVATMPASNVKGISYLLDAAAKLKESTKQKWHLTIVGDGEARLSYQEQAARLNILDKVDFLGRKPKTEIARLMQEADVFVLPSIWDNMPCVTLEAMACGLPIVATEVGGIPEIVSDQVGFLVPAKNAGALCNALREMLDQHSKYDCHKIATIAQGLYSQKVVGDQLHSIYQECINESIH